MFWWFIKYSYTKDVASDGKSLEEVNLVSAVLAGVTNAGLALVGRGFSKVDSMNNLKGLDKSYMELWQIVHC